MTRDEVLALLRKKSNKYGAVRSGGKGSKLEHSVFQILQFREKAKEITDLRSQHTVILTNAKIHWACDFSFTDCKTGELVYAEAKGVTTERYGIVEKLWRFYGPARLEVWRGHWKQPYLHETIIPKGTEYTCKP